MNANIGERNSDGLSLQPDQVSQQPRDIICPKCQHQRTAADHGPAWQCPSCGIAYNKATPPAEPVSPKDGSAASARGRQEINRDELDAETPGVVSLSLRGRIGRLRYLAFSWPTLVLSGLLMMLAVLPNPAHQSPTIMLVVLFCVLWIWVSLRLMALRMHDLNQSAKWLLVLLLLPGAAFAVGKPQMGMMFAGLFWVVALLLLVLPGSEGDNEYGPPPAANTTWVKVGAGLMLALMALGAIGNIKMMRSGKLHSALSSTPAASRQDEARRP